MVYDTVDNSQNDIYVVSELDGGKLVAVYMDNYILVVL